MSSVIAICNQLKKISGNFSFLCAVKIVFELELVTASAQWLLYASAGSQVSAAELGN